MIDKCNAINDDDDDETVFFFLNITVTVLQRNGKRIEAKVTTAYKASIGAKRQTALSMHSEHRERETFVSG